MIRISFSALLPGDHLFVHLGEKQMPPGPRRHLQV